MTKLQSPNFHKAHHIQCAKVDERKKSEATLYGCSYFTSYKAKTHYSPGQIMLFLCIYICFHFFLKPNDACAVEVIEG